MIFKFILFTLLQFCQILPINSISSAMPRSPLVNPKVQKVDAQTWRIASHSGEVFDDILKTLSQQYIVQQVDKKNLSIVTDWDKFSVRGKMFRNRMSFRLFHRISFTEVIIKNQVEQLQELGPNQITWVPTPDITTEVQRVLNQSLREARQ